MSAVLTALETAIGVAKIISENQESLEKVVEAGAPIAKKAAGVGAKAGSSVANAAGKAASSAGSAAGRLFGTAAGAVRDKQDERAQIKALIEARGQVLSVATVSYDAGDYVFGWNQAIENSTRLPLESPGYYAIVTYKGKPRKDALGNYSDVFVGRSENMGVSVFRHVTGYGNPDVYADVKNKQHVRIYAYPDFDDTDDNNVTLGEFVTALGADASYNAREIEACIPGAVAFEVLFAHDKKEYVESRLNDAFSQVALEEEELCGGGLVKCRFTASMES